MSTPDKGQVSHFGSVQLIPLEDIVESPFQVRIAYGDIDRLADDIKKHGLLQPVLCRTVKGKLELVHGHRRTRAVKKLGWTHIRAFVKKMSGTEAIVLQGSENLQRKNYNAIEEATLYLNYQKLMKKAKTPVGEKKIGKTFSTSAGNVKNKMGLLDLPKSIQLKIINGKIAVGSGIRLITLTKELGHSAERPKSMAGVPDKGRIEKYYPEIERIGLEIEKGRQTKGIEGLRTREGVEHTVSLVKLGEGIESALEKAKIQEVVLRAKQRVDEGKSSVQIMEEITKSQQDPEVLYAATRNLLIENLKNSLRKKHIKCPHCGEDDLEWACLHRRVVADE